LIQNWFLLKEIFQQVDHWDCISCSLLSWSHLQLWKNEQSWKRRFY